MKAPVGRLLLALALVVLGGCSGSALATLGPAPSVPPSRDAPPNAAAAPAAAVETPPEERRLPEAEAPPEEDDVPTDDRARGEPLGTEAPGAVPALALAPVGFDALAGWADDDPRPALRAFLRSCDAWRRQPPDAPLGPRLDTRAGAAPAVFGHVADWMPACDGARRLMERPPGLPEANVAEARGFVQATFAPLRVRTRDDETGLFTGYFEPLLRGALDSTARYRVPLYRPPRDLVTVELGAFAPDLAGRRVTGRAVPAPDGTRRLVPYFDRAAIAGGVLAGHGLELVWVDSRIDAFFLEIQGSGRVRLPDGRRLRVGYAGANGRAYRAIGRDLIAMGELSLDEVSLQSIRAWLAAHPAQADSVMNLNAAAVFFRRLDTLAADLGPLGAQQVPLTPRRSLAVDRRFVPLGVPLWLETTAPDASGGPARPFRRLMVAQDTGGAIRGAVRGDVFWGTGPEARARAGRMKQPGRYAVLVPRALARNGMGRREAQGEPGRREAPER